MPSPARFAERALTSQLARIATGTLTLSDGSTRHTFGGGGVPVHITVHDPRFYSAVALGGHIGSAESYAKGWWSCEQLPELVALLLRNRQALEGLESWWSLPLSYARKLWHALNRNTRNGSKLNIGAHYDLGNEFFAHILDDTLTYSCGVFERPDATLREASIAKYDRICRKLGLAARDHVLEIGTGWGGFALHAAGEYGCRVTTTTISREQHAKAEERVVDAGLNGRITLLTKDYRDLTGSFDALVSIEMIEAVGHQYYDGFFAQCANLLAPHGRMALQAITIEDHRFERAKSEVDFIKRYIFPGSCIPSTSVLAGAAAHTDLRLVQAEEIGLHYAETLRCWCENMLHNRARIRMLGFTEEFIRLWEFYFAYCEGGFRTGALGDIQLVFAKPEAVAAQPFWHLQERVA